MRINSIGSYNLSKPLFRQSQFVKINQPSCDVVSFSGQKKKAGKNSAESNINFGIKTGNKVLETLSKTNSKDAVLPILARRLPEVSIHTAEEISNTAVAADTFVAYFESTLNDDFSLGNRKMFLDLAPFKYDDELEKLTFALDIAHESTHAEQVNSGRDSEFYKKMSKGNPKYAGAVIALGKCVFQLMDSCFQKNMVSKTFLNYEDMSLFSKYGREIPRESDVSKHTLLKNGNFNSQGEFFKEVNGAFEAAYVKTLQYIVQNPQDADETLINALYDVIRDNKQKELMADVKKECCYLAESELEARKTESKLAKEYLKTTKPINLDAYIALYDMMAGALQ